jgi:uncharacterized DUF497 family protein
MKITFEWDHTKDELNQAKRGVSFSEASEAFFDPNRIVAKDIKHSSDEERFYCIGKVHQGILTVRFTYRDGNIRIIGAGFWRKGREIYESIKLY